MKTLKERAAELLRKGAGEATIFVAFDLLQELVNESEPEPVLVVETEPGYWNRGHYCEGTKSYIDPTKVWGLPVGTKLYTAPPAPSVPEAEPVARVTGYYAGYLSLATVDGRVLPSGTALYTAPPAPSVPELLTATNPAQISSLAEPQPPAPSVPNELTLSSLRKKLGLPEHCAERRVLCAIDDLIAKQAPADVARDAERWLSQRDLELLVTFGMQADDCDADGHTLSKEQTRRLCELGVLRNVGFGRHEMTAFGDSVFGAHHLRHGISLPLQTHAEYNAARGRQGGE